MYRNNEQHRQIAFFSGLNELPKKLQTRLEESWAGAFYDQVFSRIDEDRFAVLYSEDPSRPNIPVNVLVCLEILKAGFGWSDQEMYENFCFDVQVRYAVGYRDLGAGHFDLRTMYNFRQRLAKHMQETGDNLFEQTFEQVTDEQLEAFCLRTDQQRMDSSQIASNIRETTRLQLLVEVLQRVHRGLTEADQARLADEFAPYLKGSAGQYTYRIKGKDAYTKHLQQVGELMNRLVNELAVAYGEAPMYQTLVRVFNEHFFIGEAKTLRPKQGHELSANSLQSPDDVEATYRKKRGKDYVGYVLNVTETCHADNDFQLITLLQTEPNNTDDAHMLVEALPRLTERTDIDKMYTDGGYNSPDADQVMRDEKVEQVQTAIRGQQPAEGKFNLTDCQPVPFGYGNSTLTRASRLPSLPLTDGASRSNPVASPNATSLGLIGSLALIKMPTKSQLHLPSPRRHLSFTSPSTKLIWLCVGNAVPKCETLTRTHEQRSNPQ